MKKTYVPPSGNPEATIAIVGEQPGFQEVRGRKPFIGPSGQGLDECLLMARIARSDTYLTNTIKDLDKPLDHYIHLDNRGRSTVSEEGLSYIKELGTELSALPNLNVAVAAGNIALLALCSRTGITKWRGSMIESTLVPGLKVVPTFHPATFIPPKFNFINKPIIVEDLKKAAYESTFKDIRRTPRKVITRPSFSQSIGYLNDCLELGLGGRTISLDIEVINGEVDCISFSHSPTEAISIPFRDSRGDYFTVDQELEIMVLVAKILQSEEI